MSGHVLMMQQPMGAGGADQVVGLVAVGLPDLVRRLGASVSLNRRGFGC